MISIVAVEDLVTVEDPMAVEELVTAEDPAIVADP